MSSESDQDLNSLLVNIRSVVQSCKGGVLLNNLQVDYKKLIGSDIPFEKFGYDSLETLLQNAPNFISIRKNTNGQLFAEAVSDSSTAHLSSLISKQKRGKSKKDPKSLVLKSKSCGSFKSRKNDGAIGWSNFSAYDQKNKEIEELKSKLEREKSINEELIFEISRLHTELKVANKASLNSIAGQKHQEELEDLKSKFEKEKKVARDFSSQIIRLNSLVRITQDSLLKEQNTVKELKSQVEALQSSSVKESSKMFEYLSSATNSKEQCKNNIQNVMSSISWDDHLNLLEVVDAENQSICGKSQSSMLAVLKSYEEQMSNQMQKFVSQIKKQNQKLMLLEKTQQKNYQKLDEKIRNLNELVNIENIIQKIIDHPQLVKLKTLESPNFVASDNVYQSIPSITPISSQSDNESELSFKTGPTFTIRGGKYGPPQAEAYGRKKGYCSISYKLHQNF